MRFPGHGTTLNYCCCPFEILEKTLCIDGKTWGSERKLSRFEKSSSASVLKSARPWGKSFIENKLAKL